VPVTAASDNPVEQACNGAGGNNGTSGTGGATCSSASGKNLSDVIVKVTNIIIFIVGAASVLMLIIGGFRYVLSGGDSAGVEGAKNTILYAIIGVIVAIMSYAIVNFVICNIEGICKA
jgi:hypothetical protein